MRPASWAGLVALPFLGAWPAILPGQDVHLGSRIRITAPALGLQNTVGTFQGLLADSLRLDSMVVPLRSVTRLEVSQGRSSALTQGLGLGLVGGVLLGAALGAASCEEGMLSQGECVAAAGLGGALAGAVVGTAVGAAVKREKWTALRIEPLLQGSSLITGLGLALRIQIPSARGR